MLRAGVSSNFRDGEGSVVVPWWSFTKTVLAAAALKLVEQGESDLDRPLSGKPYTLRQLLQHTAGLPEYGCLSEYHEAVGQGGDPWPMDEMLSKSRADTLLFEPGGGWRYSNIGYALLRLEIERVTGMSLKRALDALVFAPFGVEAAVAQGRGDLQRTGLAALEQYHPGWVYHGLVVGTPHAAARLLWALSRGKLLERELFERMRRPLLLDVSVEGRPWKRPAYGLGLMINADAKLPCWGHTGQGPGSVLAVYYFPDPSPCAVAVFDQGADQGVVEGEAVEYARRLQGALKD